MTSRCKSQYLFYLITTLYNTSIILQVLLGATLTALGSLSSKHEAPIVVLAAANTVNAGILALLHNSGLRKFVHESCDGGGSEVDDQT